MIRTILFFLLFSVPIAMASAASPVVTEQAQLGHNQGTIKVDVHLISPSNNDANAKYIIKIFRNGQNTPMQEIDAFAEIDKPWIELVDLNGDGYVDILFNNIHAGFGSGPTIGADVFMYIPKIKKFVMSKTLTGRGQIEKASVNNCVNVLYKSSMMGYTGETWCFIQAKGIWKMDSSQRNEPDE